MPRWCKALQLKEALRQLGWNKYERDAYASLVEQGAASAADLAVRVNIPSGRIHSVLKNLRKLDAVKGLGGRPGRYDAIHPRMVLEGAQDRLRTVCDRGLAEAEQAWEIRAESPSSPEHKCWVVEGVGGRINEIRDMLTKPKKSLDLVVDSLEWLSSKDEERLAALAKAGVSVQVVAPAAAENRLKRLAALGTLKVRAAPRITRTVCIVDSQTAMWGTERPAGGSVVVDEALAEILKKEIEAQYKDATEVVRDAITA